MAPRLFGGDEELGKRDDEYRPGRKLPSGLGIAWQQRRVKHGPIRRSMKRVAVVILGLFVVYLFIHNMPTDLQPPRGRPSYTHDTSTESPEQRAVISPPAKSQPPKKSSVDHSGTSSPVKEKEELLHDFNGPIKFYDLAVSLHAAAGTGGMNFINRNVLFAAASLKSAATLLPLACEMAAQDRSYVHFALMGRDDIDMGVLLSVNGIGKECKVMYHDARPDYPLRSSDYRMEVVTSAAIRHITNFLHPQATIIDASGEEERFMFTGLKPKALSLGRTLIELPMDAQRNLLWFTLLDSMSLSAWNKATTDIVVHAQPAASGSLMRLLDSLRKADYSSCAYPRLTIELPHEVDGPTSRYLETFRWPPNSGAGDASLLTLHHRIPKYGLTAEENSIRFLESFWPAESAWSHVIVLAPHAEVSPLFFHYLKYAMLEYKYSSSKTGLALQNNLLGISLDLPSTYLNDSTLFTAPTTNTSAATPFLWQAPNSNAALYFGDKWAELHDFVAQSLASQHKLPTPTTLNKKSVSKTYPSWLEYVLQLARARGYMTLYPSVGRTDSLVTLHSELFHTPEEYAEDIIEEKIPASGELTADPEHHRSLKQKEAPLITKPLWTVLPNEGYLPFFTGMPQLGWDGVDTDIKTIYRTAATYSTIFRHEIGGCAIDDEVAPRFDLRAGDLFCLDERSNINHDEKPRAMKAPSKESLEEITKVRQAAAETV